MSAGVVDSAGGAIAGAAAKVDEAGDDDGWSFRLFMRGLMTITMCNSRAGARVERVGDGRHGTRHETGKYEMR